MEGGTFGHPSTHKLCTQKPSFVSMAAIHTLHTHGPSPSAAVRAPHLRAVHMYPVHLEPLLPIKDDALAVDLEKPTVPGPPHCKPLHTTHTSSLCVVHDGEVTLKTVHKGDPIPRPAPWSVSPHLHTSSRCARSMMMYFQSSLDTCPFSHHPSPLPKP
eukprot:180060-Chlamydomonas_euryale.AAC.1